MLGVQECSQHAKVNRAKPRAFFSLQGVQVQAARSEGWPLMVEIQSLCNPPPQIPRGRPRQTRETLKCHCEIVVMI